MEQQLEYKIYSWKGVDKYGDSANGVLMAENISYAENQLQKQQIDIKKIKKSSAFFAGGKIKRIKPAEIALFARQVATMVSAGVPLAVALENIAHGFENLRMRAVILSIQRDVTAGINFADALKNHPKYFDNLTCSLVAAGEQSGSLDILLKQIAAYLERMEVLKSRVKKAMFYPITILVVALSVAALLLVFIVPQFADLFGSFGAKLPLPTRIVIVLSNFLQHYWWLLLAAIVSLSVGFAQAKRRFVKVRDSLDKCKINLVVFGSLFRQAIIARITRTLAITLNAGIPLMEALNCVAGVASNKVFSDAILKVKADIAEGKNIAIAMSATKVFPAMMLQMVEVGESSGSLEEMLAKVADYFDEQVNTTVDAISTLIEPFMLIILGLIIGGFVISMYLPIFKLGTVM